MNIEYSEPFYKYFEEYRNSTTGEINKKIMKNVQGETNPRNHGLKIATSESPVLLACARKSI